MQNILVIDNYDSFVFNLVHYLEGFDAKITVIRNDKVTLDEIARYDKVVLSPGPGVPKGAGLLKSIIESYASQKSILGVCLGQQAIAEVFGGTIFNLNQVFHGVGHSLYIQCADEVLYTDLEPIQQVGRYHSWSVSKPLPDCLEITGLDVSGNILSLRHRSLDVRGVQFHPESILTPNGRKMIENWINA
ncbi:MAG TPA: aminodeoxychorismate/anthranilate synthase component II [Flavobacteriaceae bacterium]|nr:aminodeoxychorismate/anthranilate synthase component II [Flavobacteriaceae bacterium]